MRFHHLFLFFGLFISLSAQSQILVGSKVVNASSNMEISIRVDVAQNSVSIEFTGPDGVYFAYGFGSSRMSGTYTLLSQGTNITERKLGNHNAGSALGNSFITNSYTVNAGVGTAIVTRARVGQSADYFTFPDSPGTITVIWARGNSNSFNYHAQRGATTISLLEEIPCEETSSEIEVSACDSYLSPSQKYTFNESGVYKDTILNSAGCDSVITINLTVNPTPKRSIDVSGCEQYLSSEGNIYETSGVYEELRSAPGDCDTLVTLNVTIEQRPQITKTISACGSYTSLSGMVYNESGQYIETRSSPGLCDSLINLSIEINAADSTEIELTGCDSVQGENGIWYSQSGVYRDSLINSNGCDSIVLYDVSISTLDSTIFQSGDSLIANETGAQYQWFVCEPQLQEISGAIQAFYVPTQSGAYAVRITRDFCEKFSNCSNVSITGLKELKLPEDIGLELSKNSIRWNKINESGTLSLVGLEGRVIQLEEIKEGDQGSIVIKQAGVYLVLWKGVHGSISSFKLLVY